MRVSKGLTSIYSIILLIMILVNVLGTMYLTRSFVLEKEENENEREGGAGWDIAFVLYAALALIIILTIAPYLFKRFRNRMS